MHMEPETPSAAEQHDNCDAAGVAHTAVASDPEAPVADAEAVFEQPQAAVQQQLQEPQDLQPHWAQLCSSLSELDSTSDLLVQLLQGREQQKQADQVFQHPASLQQQQQPDNSSVEQQQGAGSSSSGGASNSSEAVSEMQQQLSALLAEKQRIEADRQDMALQQGKYKGTIAQVGQGRNRHRRQHSHCVCWRQHTAPHAHRHHCVPWCVVPVQLEGALAFSERKVKDQRATIDTLQVSCQGCD